MAAPQNGKTGTISGCLSQAWQGRVWHCRSHCWDQGNWAQPVPRVSHMLWRVPQAKPRGPGTGLILGIMSSSSERGSFSCPYHPLPWQRQDGPAEHKLSPQQGQAQKPQTLLRCRARILAQIDLHRLDRRQLQAEEPIDLSTWC